MPIPAGQTNSPASESQATLGVSLIPARVQYVRAARLNRVIHTVEGQSLSLKKFLETLPCQNVRQLTVPAKTDQLQREATLELRFSELRMPVPKVLTSWLKEHRPHVCVRNVRHCSVGWERRGSTSRCMIATGYYIRIQRCGVSSPRPSHKS